MMSRKTRTFLAIALLAGIAGYKLLRPHADAPADGKRKPAMATAIAPAKPRMYGAIAFTPCTLRSFMSRDSVEAQCATFEVPEDHANPGGRKIALNIAWLPATNEADATPDPLFMLAGGPGQAAVETFPAMDPLLKEVRKRRHIVLVDQRGTGKSNKLACKPGDEAADGAVEPSPEAMRAQAAACVADLSKHADLRFYTTNDAVADLEAVRKAIGAAQVNLMGVSYGTRVAQQYAMHHPDAIRSIVLDSPVPNTIKLGNI
ncbi:MAG: alpha/beta fold hydrolase, partial [Xanthomonadales bacterium]|nr:alpha/beta fold hydrolase [Xanthomonadales bacterium]